MNRRNNEQEDEILNLIQKNLLYEKGPTKAQKKIARGDFAKRYVSVDKPGDIAPERFHGSALVQEAEASARKTNDETRIQVPRGVQKPGTSGAARGGSVGLKYKAESETRGLRNDMLSQYFNQKKSLKA